MSISSLKAVLVAPAVASLAVFAALAAASLAPGQVAQPPATRPAPGAQPGALPRNRFEMIQRRLERELDLDEPQKAQLAALAARHAELVAEDRRAGRKIAALYRELRDARQAADAPRVEQLQAQIAELESRRRADGLEGDPLGPFLQAAGGLMRPEQREKFEAIRHELVDQTRDGTALRELVRTLPDELKLDEPQRSKFDELVAQMREQAGVEAGRGDELRQLYEEQHAAREAGDEARAASLAAKIEELRPNPRRRFEKLFDELEPVLNDGQKAALAEIRESTLAGGGHAEGDELRLMLRLAKRIELSDEQKQKLREIERATATLERRLARRDAAGRKTLGENVKRDLLEMMTEPQRQEFEKLLEEARARAGDRREKAR
ncbi:hypothetical protein RAS1_21070 [Phycisphaerae bacterium RAS1]|nr:hypothetical protein RAS1_21070 [Phycisphaerae bacterium RAS1]